MNLFRPYEMTSTSPIEDRAESPDSDNERPCSPPKMDNLSSIVIKSEQS